MTLSFCLSEWWDHEEWSEKLLKSTDMNLLYSKFRGEAFWHQLENRVENWPHFDELGLKLNHLIYRDSAFEDPQSESRFFRAIEFCKTWGIETVTFQDSTDYLGDSESLKIRLADRVMNDERWDLYLSYFDRLGVICADSGIRLLLGNRSGFILEKLQDFVKIKNSANFGFTFDIPHFLYTHEVLTALDGEIRQKVEGMRFGSYNPCAWVATRQNQLSWTESLSFDVFQPLAMKHEKMLGKYIRCFSEVKNQLRTLSLGRDTTAKYADPLNSFFVAEATLRELVQSSDSQASKAS